MNARNRENIGIFDVNCQNDTGWCRVADWEQLVVPEIIKEAVPRGDGNWHITHAVEITRRPALWRIS